VNGDAAGEIAAAAAEIGARIIHISTDYVFDGRKECAYVPDDPTGPLGVYGRTKLDGERQVRAAAPAAVIVRTAWVYSPFGRNFVKTMMNLANTGAEIKVVADQRGSPTSALDLADGLLAVLRGWAAGGGAGVGKTYHLAGSGGEPSWFEVADLVLAEYRRLGGPKAKVLPIHTQDRPTKAERPRNSVLDSSSFEDVFGYVMPDWETSAAATVKRLAESVGD
jgi:dTDP-4-dehydrorhamnose reductase